MYTKNEARRNDHGIQRPRLDRNRFKATQGIIQQKSSGNTKQDNLRIGTWNSKTTIKTGKLEEV